MKKFALVVSVLAAAVASLPAGAATLYSNPILTGPISSPNSVSFSAASAGGAGSLNFNIDGFASLDGVNYYEDDFTLSLNGTPILQLSYDLGGGGTNSVFLNTYGAAITGGVFSYFGGGQLQVSIPTLTLAAGSNLFTFAYDSPLGVALGGGGSHAGGQGIGDEGWGISKVVLNGAPAGVPEPATWGLMILGFGAVGGALRRRTKAAVRFA